MKHLEDHFESIFEERDVFVDLLTLDEPGGVFVPDGIRKSLDGFGKTISGEIVFDFFFAGSQFAANPIFARVIGGVGKLSASGDSAFVDDFGVHFGGGDFESNRTAALRLVDHTLNKSCKIPEFIT